MNLISVIFVEDDFLVRMVVGDILREAGFDVVEAEHADHAVRILRKSAHVIHVLATDITMPGTLDGLALAHLAARSWPWIGILIMSGRPRPQFADMPAKSRFLGKPYENAAMHQHIRELAAAGDATPAYRAGPIL